jgi:rRNA maturation RNase YbeY
VSNRLEVHSRQRSFPVNCRLLRKIALTFLSELRPNNNFELEINIISEPEMTLLNEKFLQHQGSTDVLAFDYKEPSQPETFHGEIFVCADQASIQSARYRTSWQNEVMRYVVHGILHLAGYDDHHPARRREMKRQEDRFLRYLAGRFDLSRLGSNRPDFKPRTARKTDH